MKIKIYKIYAVALCCFLAVAALLGCAPVKKEGKSIVCTVFAEYDWTREIVGDTGAFTLTYLLKSGTDLHSYDPPIDDIARICDADVFIYVGGESDEWAEDVLRGPDVNKDQIALNLLEILGDKALEEEEKEGLTEDPEEEEEAEADEHVWLSLKNAALFCDKICDAICEADAANADVYRANLTAYKEKLNALDEQFETLTAGAPAAAKTLIFADRFPFRYFVEDYGLDYYAAFKGCSAQNTAGPDTIVFLAGKADEIGAKALYVIETSDGKVANSVRSATESKPAVRTLHSVQAVTDMKETYLSLMRQNYTTLQGVFALYDAE